MKFRLISAALAIILASASYICAAQAPALWIDVPFVPQVRDGCGSASISMVMQYWAKKEGQPSPPSADAQKIQAQLFSSRDGGIAASSMEAYFRESGYRVFVFRGGWNDLEHHIRLGRPLIVGLQANGPLEPLHYAVVVGIDPARGFLFLNDPAQRKMLRASREGFESEWRHTHNWTLLALPRPRD